MGLYLWLERQQGGNWLRHFSLLYSLWAGPVLRLTEESGRSWISEGSPSMLARDAVSGSRHFVQLCSVLLCKAVENQPCEPFPRSNLGGHPISCALSEGQNVTAE